MILQYEILQVLFLYARGPIKKIIHGHGYTVSAPKKTNIQIQNFQ